MQLVQLARDFFPDVREVDRKFIFILLFGGVCLWADYYVDDYAVVDAVRPHLPWGIAELDRHFLRRFLTTGACLVTLLLVPCLAIKLVLKEPLRDYGLFPPEPWKDIKLGVQMFAFMVPLVLVVSYLRGFQSYYPLYPGTREELVLLVAFELAYALYFVGWEFFFRGFLLFGTVKQMGISAIFVWAALFSAVHFGKPGPEALGAVACAVILGYVSYKTKSIWAGVIAHALVAVALDLTVLLFH